MTDPTEQELEQLLDDIFIAHEDNDSFTCNANYTTCTECHQRYYYQSWRPCSHNAKRTIGECNCSLKEEKQEAKAQLLAWRDRAVRAALDDARKKCYALYANGELEAYLRLSAETKEQLMDTVPLLAQKCYNCGNRTVQIDDRARCPYCGCHESLAEPKENV